MRDREESEEILFLKSFMEGKSKLSHCADEAHVVERCKSSFAQ